jgi:hypothetical protein
MTTSEKFIKNCCDCIPYDIARDACTRDLKTASDEDLYQAALCLNTWAHLGLDIGLKNFDLILISMLRAYGLSGSVQVCNDMFYCLIDNTSPAKGAELYHCICNFMQIVGTAQIDCEAFRKVSLVLRFAKRFTYIGKSGDDPEERCYNKFIKANKECWSWSDGRSRGIIDANFPGIWERLNISDVAEITDTRYPSIPSKSLDKIKLPGKVIRPYLHRMYDELGLTVELQNDVVVKWLAAMDPREAEGDTKGRVGNTLIMKVKEYITEMVGKCPIVPPVTLHGGFSKGSASRDITIHGHISGNFTVARKVSELYSLDQRYDHRDTGHFVTGGKGTHLRGGAVKYALREHDGQQMIAVPKSMTERRLIKPEPVIRANYAYKVRQALEASIIATDHLQYINWDDQTVNQEKARLGSAGLGYSTIDLSAASDRQSRDITFMLWPEGWRSYLFNSITDYVLVGDKRLRVRCFSTSGNQLTWLVMGVTVWAIAEYGCSWYLDKEGNPLHAFTYGDDLIIPDCAYDTVTELLTLFGFVINDDKSYTGSCAFRESCGGDYIYGYGVAPTYWRRGAVNIQDYPDTISYICQLQQRLYEFPYTRVFLERCAFSLDPKMTFSAFNTECDDLWDGNLDPWEDIKRPHRGLVTVSKPVDNYPQQLQDHQYFRYLENGPSFASDQDRRFGISIPYLDPSMVSKPTVKWTTKKPPFLSKER